MTTKKTIAQNAAPLASDEDDETLARAFVIWLAAFALALLFSVFVISDAQSAGLHVAEKNAVSPILRPAQAMPSGLIAATDAALAPTAIASDFDARPGSTLAVTAAAAPTSAGAASEAARATEPNARINPASSGKDGTGEKTASIGDPAATATNAAADAKQHDQGRTALGFRPLQKRDVALGGIFAAMMVAGFRLGNRRP